MVDNERHLAVPHALRGGIRRTVTYLSGGRPPLRPITPGTLEREAEEEGAREEARRVNTGILKRRLATALGNQRRLITDEITTQTGEGLIEHLPFQRRASWVEVDEDAGVTYEVAMSLRRDQSQGKGVTRYDPKELWLNLYKGKIGEYSWFATLNIGFQRDATPARYSLHWRNMNKPYDYDVVRRKKGIDYLAGAAGSEPLAKLLDASYVVDPGDVSHAPYGNPNYSSLVAEVSPLGEQFSSIQLPWITSWPEGSFKPTTRYDPLADLAEFRLPRDSQDPYDLSRLKNLPSFSGEELINVMDGLFNIIPFPQR